MKNVYPSRFLLAAGWVVLSVGGVVGCVGASAGEPAATSAATTVATTVAVAVTDPAKCTEGEPHWIVTEAPPGQPFEDEEDIVVAVDDVIVATIVSDVEPVVGDRWSRRCENATTVAHRSVVRVDETLVGDLEPGTEITVLARDTFEPIYAPPSDENPPQMILALDHNIEVPGVGMVEWAAYGTFRATRLGSRDEYLDAIAATTTTVPTETTG